jgi:hypothetical protein
VIRSGKAEGLLYSLSRWTDLPAAKWAWLTQQLRQGWMVGFDPRNAVPSQWSLAVEDTLGLVFWTRDPTNLVQNVPLLKPYPLVIHMTLTGWQEVEKGAPDIEQGLELMAQAIKAFGVDNVVWRFSPVPAVKDTVERFKRIARGAEALGVKKVYVAFLQSNDLMPEERPLTVRQGLLRRMAEATRLEVRVCNGDRTLDGIILHATPNLGYGVCEDGHHFLTPEDNGLGLTRNRIARHVETSTEDCGCALAVDPFTITESCNMGCSYCYAADKNLSPCKRDTTGGNLR